MRVAHIHPEATATAKAGRAGRNLTAALLGSAPLRLRRRFERGFELGVLGPSGDGGTTRRHELSPGQPGCGR